MIIVKPVGGLANRMRVLAAAIDLAESCEDKVQCIWEASDELGATYTDLFKESDRFSLINHHFGTLKSSYKKNPVKRILAAIWNKLHGVDYYFSLVNIDKINEVGGDQGCFFRMLAPLLKKGKIIYFSSGSYLADLTDVSLFQPVEDIQKLINEYARTFSPHTLGMHIRRTDNTWAIDNSPIELFIKTIKEGIKSDKEVVYYLSTDDKNISISLKDEFQSHIIVREKHYGRGSIDAMKDAVVDMWLLSKTNHIFGSYYSSFSEMAALVGNVELTIIKR